MTERVLVVCEKPTAARRIAQALDDDGAPESFSERGVPYHVARRGKLDLIVVSALGHLFSVAQKGGKWVYPVFDYEWVPSYVADKRMARTRRFVEVIGMLSPGVGGYVSACDYDMEGSLIGYMILRHICGEESVAKAGRMRYSTLTDRDLNRAWDEMSDSLDFPLIEAGRIRHEVDWLFGINLTRALTLVVKNATGFYKVLSVGRVQGPTLNFIKEREVEIQTFVPTPFWLVKAEIRLGRKKYSLEHEASRILSASQAAKVVAECEGKEGDLKELEKSISELPPLPPFSLGDLQREAYGKFRYAPRTTLRAAERLYLGALISYPRTSSQRLPPSIDLRRILEGLREQKGYADFASRLLGKSSLRPRQGKKDDPAHPAIHPTGKKPGRLEKVDARVYDLICRRFMASLEDPAVRESTRATVDVNGHIFYLKGSRLVEEGWTGVYGPYYRDKGVVLPALKIGRKIPIRRVEAPRRLTRPPPRFNLGSLLALMEREGIGTKATRSDVIDTMFKRGYVDGREIGVTDLGFTVVEALDRIVPEILSVEMTRKLEADIEDIRAGETDADEVVAEAIRVLGPALSKFKLNEERIGISINDSLLRAMRKGDTLGACPVCETGEIRIITSKATGKRFAGCTNYFQGSCDASYPLPQKGKIKATGKKCSVCGAPRIRVVRRRKRPWDLCINIDCPSKTKRDPGHG
ncbi:MAG: DNA topoisomerase I [Candidatus Bathyarchaeia archaeon]